MNLLAWLMNAWATGTWRVGAWESAGTVPPTPSWRVIQVKEDARDNQINAETRTNHV